MASQTEVVLKTLQENTWVCGTSFQKMYIPTYSQRVADLIKKGHRIDRVSCDLDHHRHKGNVFMYRLVVDLPTLEDQQSFF